MTKTLVFLRGFPLMNLLIIRWKLTVDGKGQVFVVVFFFFSSYFVREVCQFEIRFTEVLWVFSPLVNPLKFLKKLKQENYVNGVHIFRRQFSPFILSFHSSPT